MSKEPAATSGPTFTDTDKAAIKAAEDAGLKSTADIGGTDLPNLEKLHMKVLALEGLLDYLFKTHFRNVNTDEVVAMWLEGRKRSETINPKA